MTDAGNLSTAADEPTPTQQIAAVGSACSTFRSDIEKAQAYAPMPIPSLEKDWAAALAEYARGTTDCLAGVNNLDTNLIVQAASEISAGTNDLNSLSSQIQHYVATH